MVKLNNRVIVFDICDKGGKVGTSVFYGHTFLVKFNYIVNIILTVASFIQLPMILDKNMFEK